MNIKKAIICTVIYAFTIIALLCGALFVKNDELNITLYEIIMHTISTVWLVDSVRKFYNWLIKKS